ncbi:unnamed protein product [Caretta caretta]
MCLSIGSQESHPSRTNRAKLLVFGELCASILASDRLRARSQEQSSSKDGTCQETRNWQHFHKCLSQIFGDQWDMGFLRWHLTVQYCVPTKRAKIETAVMEGQEEEDDDNLIIEVYFEHCKQKKVKEEELEGDQDNQSDHGEAPAVAPAVPVVHEEGRK